MVLKQATCHWTRLKPKGGSPCNARENIRGGKWRWIGRERGNLSSLGGLLIILLQYRYIFNSPILGELLILG